MTEQDAQFAPPVEGEEVGELVAWLRELGPCSDDEKASFCRAADLLEQFSAAQTPQPVPVSERLPTGDALCWTWYEPDEDDPSGYGGCWALLPIGGGASSYTHWLPAHALPLPSVEVQP